MQTITVTNKDGIEALRAVSAITIEGLCEESIEDFAKWAVECKAAGSLDKITAHIIPGSVMNEAYDLTGSNAYASDLNIVSLTGVDVSKLIIARFRVGARWLDDIIDNNLRREGTLQDEPGPEDDYEDDFDAEEEDY